MKMETYQTNVLDVTKTVLRLKTYIKKGEISNTLLTFNFNAL